MPHDNLKYTLSLPKTGLVRVAYCNLEATVWGYDDSGKRCPVTPHNAPIRLARGTDISYWWQPDEGGYFVPWHLHDAFVEATKTDYIPNF